MSKSDSAGDKRRDPEHLYAANPQNPAVCVVLGLAIFQACDPQHEKSALLLGSRQRERFIKSLSRLLKKCGGDDDADQTLFARALQHSSFVVPHPTPVESMLASDTADRWGALWRDICTMMVQEITILDVLCLDFQCQMRRLHVSHHILMIARM
jgi:hypothetical protein